MNATCPTCHQTIGAVRLGLKASIVDKIKAAGDVGITSTELLELWRDRRPVAPTTIKSHANQINDLLAATDWRLHSDRRRWYLCRERSL
jgi:hypothetical protein